MRSWMFAAALTLAAPSLAAPPAPQVYAVRPDPRLCPGPMCGGWWISRVNHAQLRCADGTTAGWCYVAEIDWSGLGLPPQDEARLAQEAAAGRALVLGSLYLTPFAGQPLGGLAAQDAWVAFP
ncbi:MAG TPA: hypothetical protein PKA64_13805 [Myxococcota bacterium]|nr:hypothetical protein [Myxococcota bacterium]